MTLLEVSLAVVIGLILILAATQAFSFAKRSAIRTKQDKNVQMFKSMIEQLKASAQGGAGDNYPLKLAQMKSFVERVPNFARDPYFGSQRLICDLGGSCPQGSVYTAFGPFADTASPISSVDDVSIKLTAGSDLIYLYGSSLSTKFTVTTADGISREFLGFVILESDSDGKIVTAAGGGTGDE